jgi:hypothetical protein
MGDHAAGRGSDDAREEGRVVIGELRLYVVYLLVGNKSPQRREYRERLQDRFHGAPCLPRVELGEVRHAHRQMILRFRPLDSAPRRYEQRVELLRPVVLPCRAALARDNLPQPRKQPPRAGMR